jgi:hypothetical protein
MTHPIAGVWMAEVDDETRSRVTQSFRDDGTVLVTSAFHAAQGTWRPTGERTAELVVLRPTEAEGRRFVGWQAARGSVEVSEDGAGFLMSSRISRPLPDGGVEEQAATITGTRLVLG